MWVTWKRKLGNWLPSLMVSSFFDWFVTLNSILALNIKNERKLSYLVLYDQNGPEVGEIEGWAKNQKYFNLFPLEGLINRNIWQRIFESEKSRPNQLLFLGLNVKSLLKYDKLIFDIDMLNRLESKLLFEIQRYDFLESHRIAFETGVFIRDILYSHNQWKST